MQTQRAARRSNPAVILVTGLTGAAGLFLLTWTDLVRPDQLEAGLRPVVSAALAVGAAVVGGRWLYHHVPRPSLKPVAVPREFPEHRLAEVAPFVSGQHWEPPAVPWLIDYLLRQAVRARASDVHLVPYERFLAVRFRVDGILQNVAEVPGALREPVTSRLKVLSRLVSFVRDRPQDGRFEFMDGAARVDVRVAFMPTLHGERTVLRLLRRTGTGFHLDRLGLLPGQLAALVELLRRPQGMIVLTGPSGSGKTTTIYSALASVLEQSHRSRSIYTLEDPIEYDLLQINQTQVEEAHGFTFAQGLRSLLRQDPDVIMVGEIRDLETARIALQAGMTGHLIITTLHARSAAGVFTRLVEMGCEVHSVAAALTAVVSQRLVRRLCAECRRPGPAGPWAADVGLGPESVVYTPGGCGACAGSGFRGRRGLFELMAMDEGLSRLVVRRAGADELQREARGRGMKTLAQVGAELASAGETSLAEVLRVAPPDAEKPD